MAAKAQGAPTKEFFVGMLTRDIELSDAILDLLDNCLDGVVRQKKGIDKTTTSDYYVGFFSHILEMSRNVQSGNTQNLKSMVIQRSFPKWSVAERRKTAA
ncbi:hypothetical protein ACTQ33_15410, partial [Candidatus Avoscillospira sp. LCP25S3_F1]|uniref:hypothetical protein n=1 Tax=Candidatus Avoscillospira sp. LCP25S3_F1 TaxID=3438825 RepID=UPI003F929238